MWDGGAVHDQSEGATAGGAEGESCAACHDPYQTVYHVPDGVWDQISGGVNLLCLPCADGRARKLGIELYWEAEVGEFPRDFRRRIEQLIEKNRPVLDRLAET
jgi:hypothetical protein